VEFEDRLTLLPFLGMCRDILKDDKQNIEKDVTNRFDYRNL